MTLRQILQGPFRYVLIAVAISIGLFIAVVLTDGSEMLPNLGALAVITYIIFSIFITQSRQYWGQPSFWFVVGGFLTVHLLAFILVLRTYPQWRVFWFVPVAFFELGSFGAILVVLFGRRRRT